MIISEVQAFLLSCPLPEPLELTYHGGRRTILKRDAMLIRIAAGNLVGYGPGPASETAHRLITDEIAPFLRGRTLADPDALRVQFAEASNAGPALLKLYCAVEIALYDLLGKARGLPVSELLGGRVRDSVRLYGSAGMYLDPGKSAEEAAQIAALGFRAYKMRAGLGPERDLEAVLKMRDAVGPDFEIMVDAHTWWRMGNKNYGAAAISEVAREMGDLEVCWLEEPFPPLEHAAYRQLRELDIIPVASGEHEPDEAGFSDLINGENVDVVQMDIVCQGGFPAARKLFPHIGRAGMSFAFHSWGTALEIVAAAQLGICWPENVVEWLEHPCYSGPSRVGMYPFPLAEEIVRDPLIIEEGHLRISQAPGLGVDIDEAVLDRYPWLPGPWSYFHIEQPAEVRAVTGDHSIQWATS